MAEKRKTGIVGATVEPSPEGTIGKTPPDKLVPAVYVGKHPGVTVPRLGLMNWPRGKECLVPPWFREQCQKNKNKEWEFPKKRGGE